MQVFRLVPLAHRTPPNKVLHELFHVRKMEVASQPVECALHPFVAVLMHRHHDLLDKGGGRGNVQPSRKLDHAVGNGPWRAT